MLKHISDPDSLVWTPAAIETGWTDTLPLPEIPTDGAHGEVDEAGNDAADLARLAQQSIHLDSLRSGTIRYVYFAAESMFKVGSRALSNFGQCLCELAAESKLCAVVLDELHEFFGCFARPAMRHFVALKQDGLDGIPWLGMTASISDIGLAQAARELHIECQDRVFREERLFH